jgi:hypothetical protein
VTDQPQKSRSLLLIVIDSIFKDYLKTHLSRNWFLHCKNIFSIHDWQLLLHVSSIIY